MATPPTCSISVWQNKHTMAELFGCFMNKGCDGGHDPDDDPSTVGKSCNKNLWTEHGEGDNSLARKRTLPLDYERVFGTAQFSKKGGKFLIDSPNSGRSLNQNAKLKELRIYFQENPLIFARWQTLFPFTEDTDLTVLDQNIENVEDDDDDDDDDQNTMVKLLMTPRRRKMMFLVMLPLASRRRCHKPTTLHLVLKSSMKTQHGVWQPSNSWLIKQKMLMWLRMSPRH